MENLSYAVRLLGARVMRQPKHCPSCGNARTERLARKKLLAELRRCPECRLKPAPLGALRRLDFAPEGRSLVGWKSK